MVVLTGWKRDDMHEDILPQAQPETESCSIHISYFLQNCKKGKPSEMDMPYWKLQIWNQGQDVSRIKGFPASWYPDNFIADHSLTQTWDKRIYVASIPNLLRSL